MCVAYHWSTNGVVKTRRPDSLEVKALYCKRSLKRAIGGALFDEIWTRANNCEFDPDVSWPLLKEWIMAPC